METVDVGDEKFISIHEHTSRWLRRLLIVQVISCVLGCVLTATFPQEDYNETVLFALAVVVPVLGLIAITGTSKHQTKLLTAFIAASMLCNLFASFAFAIRVTFFRGELTTEDGHGGRVTGTDEDTGEPVVSWDRDTAVDRFIARTVSYVLYMAVSIAGTRMASNALLQKAGVDNDVNEPAR